MSAASSSDSASRTPYHRPGAGCPRTWPASRRPRCCRAGPRRGPAPNRSRLDGRILPCRDDAAQVPRPGREAVHPRLQRVAIAAGSAAVNSPRQRSLSTRVIGASVHRDVSSRRYWRTAPSSSVPVGEDVRLDDDAVAYRALDREPPAVYLGPHTLDDDAGCVVQCSHPTFTGLDHGGPVSLPGERPNRPPRPAWRRQWVRRIPSYDLLTLRRRACSRVSWAAGRKRRSPGTQTHARVRGAGRTFTLLVYPASRID